MTQFIIEYHFLSYASPLMPTEIFLASDLSQGRGQLIRQVHIKIGILGQTYKPRLIRQIDLYAGI